MLGEAGGAHEKGAFPSYKEAFIKMFFFILIGQGNPLKDL